MAVGLCVALAASLTYAQDDTTFFRIGTGPAADTEYALGSSIAAGITNPPGSRPCHQGGSCGVPGLIAVAQTKSGSIENLQAIGSGNLESALVHSDMLAYVSDEVRAVPLEVESVYRIGTIEDKNPDAILAGRLHAI